MAELRMELDECEVTALREFFDDQLRRASLLVAINGGVVTRSERKTVQGLAMVRKLLRELGEEV